MGRLFSVKLHIFLLLLLACPARLHAESPPDARELLRAARMVQADQNVRLVGSLRIGGKKHPIRLSMDKGAVRYEFTDNGDTLTLRFGDKTSTLEQTRGGKTTRISAAQGSEAVRDTDITHEDLMLRFLYWQDAKVTGSDVILGRACWKVEVLPPSPQESRYRRVVLWIGKEDGALMKAESYGPDDRWARRFVVNKVMKRDGYWLLKELRIESPSYQGRDSKPTYLSIDDVEK